MMQTRSRFAIFASSLVLFTAFASAQKTFVRPHALDVNGSLVGIAWDWTGGQELVERGADGKPTSSFGSLSLFSFWSNEKVFTWVRDTMNGGTSPFDHNIYPIAKYITPCLKDSWYDLAGVTFPACDVDSKEPDGVLVRTKSKVFQKQNDPQIASKTLLDNAKKQKTWLNCNFRVKIGDLPASRISRIDPINFDPLMFVNAAGGTERKYSAGYFTMTLGSFDAPMYREAFNSTLSGAPKEYLFQLDYLDEAGNVLMGVKTMVWVVGFGPTNPFADPADPDFTYSVTLLGRNGGEVVLNPMSGF